MSRRKEPPVSSVSNVYTAEESKRRLHASLIETTKEQLENRGYRLGPGEAEMLVSKLLPLIDQFTTIRGDIPAAAVEAAEAPVESSAEAPATQKPEAEGSEAAQA